MAIIEFLLKSSHLGGRIFGLLHAGTVQSSLLRSKLVPGVSLFTVNEVVSAEAQGSNYITST